jgi:hypothetical protein
MGDAAIVIGHGVARVFVDQSRATPDAAIGVVGLVAVGYIDVTLLVVLTGNMVMPVPAVGFVRM